MRRKLIRIMTECATFLLSRIGEIIYKWFLPRELEMNDVFGSYKIPCVKVRDIVMAIALHDDPIGLSVYRQSQVVEIGRALIGPYAIGLLTPQLYHEAAHILNGKSGKNARFSEIRADLVAAKLLKSEGWSTSKIVKGFRRGNRMFRALAGEFWLTPEEMIDPKLDPHPDDDIRVWYIKRYLERLK